MFNAAEEAYGIGMSGTSITAVPEIAANTPIDTTIKDQVSDKQWLVKLLIDAGIKGKRSELRMLAHRFHQQPHTLRLIAAYLKRWYAGRMNGLETITGLTEAKDEDALGRVLNAFENKLRGASDLTLLYLLSLSDSPVPQQHMKNVFRSTLMERWLTRRDDYVRFLGPLGRLNTEHWQWVVENLRRLQLLEQPIAGQHDLLFVEAPIREYFRHNLRAQSANVYEQAMQDMEKLFQDTVVEFRQRYRDNPEMKLWVSPELKTSLELEEKKPDLKAMLWKTEELNTMQDQLLALRNSLKHLKSDSSRLTEELSAYNAEKNGDGEQTTHRQNANKPEKQGHTVKATGKTWVRAIKKAPTRQ